MKFRRSKPDAQPGRRRMPVRRRQSPAAFSYYAQRADQGLNTGREAGRDTAPARNTALPTYLLRRAGLLLLLAAILVGLVSALGLSAQPRVIRLTTSENPYYLHNAATYQEAAAAMLGTSFWNRNKLTINTAAISRGMQAKFPELATASVTLPLLGHRPLLYIASSPPALILDSGNNSYVIDSKGVALLATTQLPTDTKLNIPLVNDQSGLTVKTGHQALSSSDVTFLQQVLGQLKARNYQVSTITLPAQASELDIRLQNQPYYVKFNMHATVEDAREQAGSFIAVQNKLASQHSTPAQYIDVRVNGRAYYQ